MTCSCRKWQVSGIPCKHALAFITSLSDSPLQNYVDLYYSVEKFGLAYSQPIPAMPDKSQWPKSTHEFFMHPPLLKTVAGRPKTERYKGSGEKKKRKKCHICLDFGHHVSVLIFISFFLSKNILTMTCIALSGDHQRRRPNLLTVLLFLWRRMHRLHPCLFHQGLQFTTLCNSYFQLAIKVEY